MNSPLSTCCNAPLRVASSGERGLYYICEKCQEPTSEKEPEPDWKELCLEMASKVIFAVKYLRCDGDGLMVDMNPAAREFKTRPWRADFMDTLEKIPGVKVDREVVYAMQLPKRERAKFFKKRKKEEKVKS